MRPQLPQQLTCLVQMSTNDKAYIDAPVESFNANSFPTTEPKIKQEVIPIPKISNILPGCSRSIISNSQMNQPIEYISNELDDDNIQGKIFFDTIILSEYFKVIDFFSSFYTVVNVYTTHLPDISSTLPTIIMQDETMSSSAQTSDLNLHNHLSLPSESYSLIGEDLIKHSFSDEGSSGDQSDVEIDL